MEMKALSEPIDNVNLVKPKGKKSQRPSDGKLNMESKKICKFCGHEHPPEKKKCPAWGKTCKKCKQKNHLPRSVPGEQQFITVKACYNMVAAVGPVYNIESEEELEEINVERIQAVNERAVLAKMLV